MLQASVFERFALDALALGEDCIGPSEVDIGRGQIVEALMVASYGFSPRRVDQPSEIVLRVLDR